MKFQWKTETFCSVVAFLIYVNTFHAGFVYDDNRAILQNADVVSTTSITNLLVNDFWGTRLNHSGSHRSYRPLTVFTFRLNFALFGMNPMSYHVTNVALHALTTFTFCAVMTSILRMSNVKTFVAGLLFAVHPVHTEAVAGIVGRADLLATFFSLITLIVYDKACDYFDIMEPTSCGEIPVVRETGKSVQTLSRCLDRKTSKKNRKNARKNKQKECNSKKKLIREAVSKVDVLECQLDDAGTDFRHLILSGSTVDRPDYKSFDSGSTSDDSNTTTSTYDSMNSISSGECQSEQSSVVGNFLLGNELTDVEVNARKLKNQKVKKEEITAHNSSHEHRPSYTGYLWVSCAFASSVCAILSKEQGYCALPICLLYDVLIRHRMGFFAIKSTFLSKVSFYRRIKLRIISVFAFAFALILFRVGLPIALTRGDASVFPGFSTSDNPAAACEDFPTRVMTFNYLIFCNVKLLVFPATLNFDWSMGSIPLVTILLDERNVGTVIVYTLLLCLLKQIWKILRRRDHEISENQRLLNSASLCGLPQSNLGTTRRSSVNSFDDGDNYNLASSGDRNNNNKLHKNRWDFKSGVRRHLTEIDVKFQGQNAKLCTSAARESTVLLSTIILVLSFLPATNLFFYVGFVIAERLLYFPSIGACILFSEGMFVINSKLRDVGPMINPRRRSRHKHNHRTDKLIHWSFIWLVILLFSSKTWIRNQDWKDEMSLYSSGVNINPAKAWCNLGNVLRTQGRYADAEAAYTTALKHRSNMADAHYNLGLLYQESGRHKMAEKSYRRAITFRPRLAVAHLNLAVVLVKQGRSEEGKKIYRRTSELDDNGIKDPKTHAHAQISALYNLGTILADEGRHADAVSAYQEAIARQLDHYKPHSLYNMLGQSLFHLGRLKDAVKWFKASLSAKPDHVPAYLTYARLLADIGQSEQSEKLYLRALDLEPDNKLIYKHYSKFHSSNGESDKAAEVMAKAAEVTSAADDYDVVFSAASAFRQANLYEKSEKYYLKAMRLAPNLPSAHMNYGAILHLRGNYEKARDCYLNALKLKPGDPLIHENLIKVERMLSKDHS